MSMKRVQQGFTLIELMIVVAIIGILAAVAIPQYRDYTSKTKVGSAIASIDGVKKGVALCYQESGTFANCGPGGTGGVPAFTATNVVSGLAYTDATGAIQLTFAAGNGASLDGKKITYTPTVDGVRMSWAVTTDVTEAAVLAAITKNTTAAAAAP